jgi:hypothetical protein
MVVFTVAPLRFSRLKAGTEAAREGSLARADHAGEEFSPRRETIPASSGIAMTAARARAVNGSMFFTTGSWGFLTGFVRISY